MNREGLDKWCERGILGLVLAILVYGPLATGAVRPPNFLVIEGLTLGVMLLWLFRLWINPRPQLLWTPLCWAVLAFAGYAVARYFTSDIEYVARWEVARVVTYTFLFLAIVNNLSRQEYTQLMTFVLVGLAAAISGYALYQFISGSDLVWNIVSPYKHRGSGTYINPNHLAGFLEMVLPLALAWILVSRAKAVTRVFLAYAAVMILGGIVVSLSRGGWAATAASMLVLFGLLLFHRNYRLPAALVLAVMLAAGFLVAPKSLFLKIRMREVTANEQFNDSARLDLWGPAVRMWHENVWWGVGPNHYNYRFREFRPQVIQRQPDRVHNDYLNTLVDWGVAGAVLVGAAWLVLIFGAVKTWRYVRGTSGDIGGGSSNKFALVLGSSMGLIAILVHSLIDFNLQIPANAILAMTLMAFLSSSLRFATEQYWTSVRLPSKLALSILLLAGMTALGWQGGRGVAEYHWLGKAGRKPLLSEERIELLKKAFAAEPRNFNTAYAIGEAYRKRCDADEQQAREALVWLERSIQLNPFHSASYLEYGICLDLPLGKVAEAESYFDKAVHLDPNGYFTTAWRGWHYVQTGDLAAARSWFERSKRLESKDNKIADSYLPIVTQLMLDAANKTPLTIPATSTTNAIPEWNGEWPSQTE